jgi:hypothetical protein
MRKRVEHNDATQEVSSSQLEPDVRKSPYPVISKNDASMWLSQPVSADDFVAPPTKKPIAPKGRNRSWLVAVSAAVVVAAIGGGVWYMFLRGDAKPSAASSTAGSAQVAAPTATPDAAAVEATDAAVAATGSAAAPAGALQVDAISAADPASKKKAATKRPATKKKGVTKKKTAAAGKRR